MEKKQNNKSIKAILNKNNSSKVIYLQMEDIYVVEKLDKLYMVYVDTKTEMLKDLLTDEEYISNCNKILVEPFNEYVLNNITAFSEEFIKDISDDQSKEVIFDCNEFLLKYDQLKHKVRDLLTKTTENLEDGTIIEEYTEILDKMTVIDKLMNINGVDEENLITLLCDSETNFTGVKKIVKSKDGKILTDQFQIKRNDNIILDDIYQLQYSYNVFGINCKKEITSQTEMEKYSSKQEQEKYSQILKISFEEKEKNKVYFK